MLKSDGTWWGSEEMSKWVLSIAGQVVIPGKSVSRLGNHWEYKAKFPSIASVTTVWTNLRCRG
jgi:hypothetical protein